MRKRRKGEGSIYLRGSVYWLKYKAADGRYIQESTGVTGSPNDKTAPKQVRDMLKTRTARVTLKQQVKPNLQRLTVGALYAAYLDYSENIKHRKDIVHLRSRWKNHLQSEFAMMPATAVDNDTFTAYAAKRKAEGASDSTCNRELSLIQAALYLGKKHKKLYEVPEFERAKEGAPRNGFLSDAEYERLAAECSKVGLWLRAMLAVGGNFCWRRGEVLNLRVRQIDLLNRTISLECGTTKNDDARLVKMTAEVYPLIVACVQGKAPDDYVFTHTVKRADGREYQAPICNFRHSWRRVTNAAGKPGLLFHDLRRTAARNLRRLGVAESVIMKIGGWKTRTVFERYNIVDDSDLADAARRLDEKARAVKQATLSATVAPEAVQAPDASIN